MVNGASRFCNSQLILFGVFASSLSTLEQRFADTKKDGPHKSNNTSINV